MTSPITDNTKLDLMERKVNSVPKEQLEDLIDFVGKHRIVLKRQYSESPKVKRLWIGFANEMSIKHEPNKTAKEWRKLLKEWKTCTKKKIRIKKVGKSKEMSIIKTVSDLDRRLFDLIVHKNAKDLFANERSLEVGTVEGNEKHDFNPIIAEICPEAPSTGEVYHLLYQKIFNLLKSDSNALINGDKIMAIMQLTDSIIKFTDIYKERTELEKVKVHAAVMNAKANYYQTFGTMNGFNDA